MSTTHLKARRISLDICGQGRLSGGGGHKLALKGRKIGGRVGHFQMAKEIEDEKNEMNQTQAMKMRMYSKWLPGVVEMAGVVTSLQARAFQTTIVTT